MVCLIVIYIAGLTWLVLPHGPKVTAVIRFTDTVLTAFAWVWDRFRHRCECACGWSLWSDHGPCHCGREVFCEAAYERLIHEEEALMRHIGGPASGSHGEEGGSLEEAKIRQREFIRLALRPKRELLKIYAQKLTDFDKSVGLPTVEAAAHMTRTQMANAILAAGQDGPHV